MRTAAADLEFEEAGRLRDEIRQLENDELGLGDGEKKAPRVGRTCRPPGNAQDALWQDTLQADGRQTVIDKRI